MMEMLSGLLVGGSVIDTLCFLAGINTVIVEVIKGIIPKSFPTKTLAVICSLLTCYAYLFVFGVVTIKTAILATVISFVISFISMFGFDALKGVFTGVKEKKNTDIGG